MHALSTMRRLRALTLAAAFGGLPLAAAAATPPTAEDVEFFEKRIRPVLVERCYECHSSRAKQLEGGLSVESREGLVRGGDQGPAVVPGEVERSLLLRALRYTDEGLQMPPDDRLPKEVVADFETWIRRGAADPRTAPSSANAAGSGSTVDIQAARQRWPFAPLQPVAVPAVRDASWPRNAIDQFILARLEAEGLAPVADADKRTLLRRVTYDLTGLPPTPAEIAAFLADDSPAALAAVVERLLASPRYGERWGRHWLDVVRYADTAGDNSDYPVPQLYKYRNWVIGAIQRDLPYDEFIRQQLAGDLLPAGSAAERHEQIIATGYLANARRFGSRVSDYPQHLTIEDTIDNLGKAFLGLSLNCARCHNHKFDPVTTEDYYALYGIFHSTRYPWPGIELEKRQRDLVPLESDERVAAARAERKRQAEAVAAEVKASEEAKKAGEALVAAAAARLEALRKQHPAAEQELPAAEKAIERVKQQAAELDAALKAAKKKKETLDQTPLPLEMAYAVAEAQKIENCQVQLKGDPARLGPEAPRRFPLVLGGQTLPADEPGSGRRQLADWIASEDNPLTARVMVNRLWLHHFGRGLVATPNDFGKQGQPPTHPELLDDLAQRFVDSGWSLKAMHRLMILSRTYGLASGERSERGTGSAERNERGTGSAERGAEEASVTPRSALRTPHLPVTPRSPADLDPTNRLLGRAHRRRLDAESIRDTLLVLGGNLDPTPGGAHPFPPQTAWDYTQHKPFKAVYDSQRRSVYLMTQRIQRHPLMAVFDGPDTSASTGSRVTSTTTLQALYFLNDPFVHEQAQRLAARLLRERSDDAERLALAYELCFARLPTADERAAGLAHLQRLHAAASQSAPSPTGSDASESAAWESLVRVLLRTNEFLYLD